MKKNYEKQFLFSGLKAKYSLPLFIKLLLPFSHFYHKHPFFFSFNTSTLVDNSIQKKKRKKKQKK